MTNAVSAPVCWAFFWEAGQLYWALLALRLLASLGAACVAWLVLGPLIRLPYRITQKKPMPAWGFMSSRLGGSFLIAVLVYSLFPGGFGGSGGPGLGDGPGTGGGPGRGQASRNGDSGGKKTKVTGTLDLASLLDGQKGKSGTGAEGGLLARVTLPIELLGGKRYKGDGRFYLVEGKQPAQDLDGVEVMLQKTGDPFGRPQNIVVVSAVGLLAPADGGPLLAASAVGLRKDVLVQLRLFPDSVDEAHSAVVRLRELADRKYRFATIIVELP